MNELTKFLIKELLDEPTTVAIYGGGFKPPTKGHFNVAKQTLEEFPEIDELKIFVGGGVRDGITQDESIQVWNIYKNYLLDKVNVEPSVAPVKSILGYAKENPDTKVYWILGAREGEESDLTDIANRTKSISKYPNLEVKVITSKGGVSGTKTRQALKTGNKEQFFHLIPDVKEKEQIWDIVSPVIKEVGEANLKPYKWEEVDVEGYFVYTRFITDSETQYDVDLESRMYVDDDFNNLRALGVEFAAKPKGAEGSSTKIVVNKGELYRVMATIVDIVKKYVKKSKAQVILYSPAKKSSEEDFGSQRDNLYKAFISKTFPGVKFEQEGEIVAAILPSVNEGTCGYDTDVATGKKLDTPGGLEEGKQVGPLYHYTSADGLKGILSSNRMNASEEYYLGNDLYYISFTRNKNFHNKGSKFGVKTDYRITLDGDKLSNRYKITPFAYRPGWNYEDNWEYDWLENEPENVVRDFFNNTGDYDEQEERISFKGPEGGIDNIKNYILAVDKVEDLQESIISETMTVYRLGEIPYDEESFFVTPDYKTWIKFYPGEEIHKITTNKLYLPLRSKSFSSWDELRSKYNSGEFTDDDVSYINPEESGIQDFEQYEIKPDDIIDLEQINLKEGREKKPDPKKGTGKKPEGSSRRLYTDEDPKDTVGISFKTKEDIVDTLNKASFKAKSHARQSQIINLIHQRVRAAYGKAKDPEVKARLKRGLDYITAKKEASKKKTERLRKMKEASDPQAGTAIPYGSGFAPIKESYQFKISDKDYDSEDNSLITVIYKFSTPDNTYRVEFYSGEYSSESKTFDVSFGLDKGYNSKLDTFQMTGEGNALSILKTVVNIIIDFTNKFEVNKLVINPTSEKRGKVYSMILKSLPSNILNKIELIQEMVTATQVICDNCGWEWDKKDGGKDLYICHKCGHNNTPKNDPFGLKEFVKEVFKKDWNLKEGMLSLTKYMMDNGMNITPLPKIKVIKDDKENASHLLGKTAYYNPTDKSITLYTLGRHPKDVLRSFSHEMVHHMQNIEGRLGNINTTNTNEDGDLPEIEREAYEKGNMMLRNWEDSIKNV